MLFCHFTRLVRKLFFYFDCTELLPSTLSPSLLKILGLLSETGLKWWQLKSELNLG